MAHNVQIEVSATAPFAVERFVLEEDTWRVLSASNQVVARGESIGDTVQAMQAFEPHVQTDVISEGQMMFAIVHDLDKEPSCTKVVVKTSLACVLATCEQQGVRAIAIEPLGCRHGALDIRWFLEVLREMMSRSRLERIWVKQE